MAKGQGQKPEHQKPANQKPAVSQQKPVRKPARTAAQKGEQKSKETQFCEDDGKVLHFGLVVVGGRKERMSHYCDCGRIYGKLKQTRFGSG